MAIIHDAYLFEPEDFVNEVAPYVERLETDPDGYTLLRDRAIELFDSSSRIRFLSAEYGGWTKGAIVDQIPASHPNTAEDTVFWLTILLYQHLNRTEPHTLGLKDKMEPLNRVTELLGWEASERRLLIRGQSFGQLTHEKLYTLRSHGQEYAGSVKLWDHFRPLSMGSSAGWLGNPYIEYVSNKLSRDYERLIEMQANQSVNIGAGEAFRLAQEMLLAASQARCGLCMLISG